MIGILIGVVGLVLSLIFGVYSIWFNKKSNKKVSLGIEKKECYSLFKSDINRLNIDVIYSGKSIENFLVLFKGVIRNNGQTDIDKNRIYKPIQIKTKSNYKWLEFSVSANPEGASVALSKTNDQTLELNWDLLKKNEFIEFESVIEIPQNSEIDEISDDFYNGLTFDFRITDLNSIDKLTEIYSKERKTKRLIQKLYLMGIFMTVCGLFIMFSHKLPENIGFLKPVPIIKYNIVSQADTIVTQIKTTTKSQIEIQLNEITVEKEIDDFNKEFRVLNIHSLEFIDSTFWLKELMGGIYILCGILAFSLIYLKRRNYRLRRVLKMQTSGVRRVSKIA